MSLEEIAYAFKVFRENSDSFSRDNYVACALLLLLAVRKSELTEAPWSEFNLEDKKWFLPKARSKSGVGIVIPLPPLAIEILEELTEHGIRLMSSLIAGQVKSSTWEKTLSTERLQNCSGLNQAGKSNHLM